MKLAACIVETRPMINLAQVIDNHMKKLPKGTDLYIFTSTQNYYLLDLFPGAKLIPIQPIRINNYNEMLLNKHFWEHFLKYNRILIFQHDSCILREGIEEFYNWDYIGASWNWNDKHPGNGGLSLRNPWIMLKVILAYPWNNNLNEDHWITMHMDQFQIGKLAPIPIADKFSVETKPIMGSWGYHAIDKHLTADECFLIKNQYNPKYTITNYNPNENRLI